MSLGDGSGAEELSRLNGDVHGEGNPAGARQPLVQGDLDVLDSQPLHRLAALHNSSRSVHLSFQSVRRPEAAEVGNKLLEWSLD